jgi:hypothetical protein
MIDSAELMTTAQVAAALGVGVDRVRALDGELRPARVGGRRVYRRSVVEVLAGMRAAVAIHKKGGRSEAR